MCVASTYKTNSIKRAIYIALSLASIASPLASALTPTEIYEKVKPSVGIVFVFDDEKLIATGSAVVIGNGKLITNRHVVEGASRLGVRINDKKYRAEVADCAAYEVDLCIISASDLTAPSVPFASGESVKVGDKVFTVGAPNEIGNALATLEMTGQFTELTTSLSDGLVSALRKVSDGTVIQTTAPISPGSSGGGLFNESGELLGITTFKALGGENLNYALPTSWIFKIPKAKAIRSERTKLPFYGLIMSCFVIALMFGYKKSIINFLGSAFSANPEISLSNIVAAVPEREISRSEKDQLLLNKCMDNAREEVGLGQVDQNKWDLAFIEAKGSEPLAKAIYINNRASELLTSEKELVWRQAVTNSKS